MTCDDFSTRKVTSKMLRQLYDQVRSGQIWVEESQIPWFRRSYSRKELARRSVAQTQYALNIIEKWIKQLESAPIK